MKKESELSQTLWKTVIPVVLGLGVAFWLIKSDINMDTLSSLKFDSRTIVGLVLALIFVIGRDFGLSWRFHTIADGDLSWPRAIRTDLMCAFTSAITPSVVGGSALAIFYLNREGIRLGRATSLTLTTLFLDELFFVIFCPFIFLLAPFDQIFGADNELVMDGIKLVFWVVYAGIVAWTAVLYYGIIARPEHAQKLIKSISRLRFLRRFKNKIDSMADNLVTTSEWVKGRPFRWWAEVFGGTILSWFSRYFVVNALFWAFVPTASGLLVFARQFVVWVVLMVSPTPGGSGISEWLFATYYGDLIGNAGIAAIIALVWRVFSYYVYLIAGCTLLPGYFRNKKKS